MPNDLINKSGCGEYPKIKIPEIDLLSELQNLKEFDESDLPAFQELLDFIQAPSHGFLIIDTLQNFSDIRQALGRTEVGQPMTALLESCDRLINQTRKLLATGPKTYFFFHSKTYLEKVQSLKTNISTEEMRDFIARCIFKKYMKTEGYITNRPLYVSLFYPYISPDIIGNDDLNEAKISFRQLRAAAFYALSQDNLKKDNDKYKALYEGLCRSSDHRFYHPIKINRAENVVDAESAIYEIKECLATNRLDQEDSSLNELAKAAHPQLNDNIIEEIYNLASDGYQQLIRFFKYFRPKKTVLDASETRPEKQSRKKYNTSAGMVVLEELVHQSINTSSVNLNGVDCDILQVGPMVDGNDLEKTLDDSLADELIIDKSVPCSKKLPFSVFSRSQANSNHLALANQVLPNAIKLSDIHVILNEMEECLARDNGEEFLHAYLFGIVTLLTGQKSEKLRLVDSHSTLPEVVSISRDLKTVCIPIPHYASKIVSVPKIYEDSEDRSLTFTFPEEIAGNILNNQTLLKKLNSHSIIKQSDFDSFLEQFFASNPFYRTKSLQRWVFNQFFYLSHGDIWQSCLITGQSNFQNRTVLHYASADQPKIFNLINQHWQRIKPIGKPISTSPFGRPRAGSPFFPKVGYFQTLFSSIRQILNVYIEMLTYWILPSKVIVEFWNLFAFYTEQFTAYGCATRDVTDPFIHPDEIMISGWTMIDDKYIDGGRNARDVWVSPITQTQLQSFLALKSSIFHKSKDRNNVKTPGLKQSYKSNLKESHVAAVTKRDLLLLEWKNREDIEFKVISYTRSKALKKAYDALEYLSINPVFQDSIANIDLSAFKFIKTNTNRHFLRAQLIEEGIAPPYVNTLMGHYQQGSEAWGGRSLFNKQKYRQEIENAIPKLETMLRLKPIPFTKHRQYASSGIPDPNYLSAKNKELYFIEHRQEIIRGASDEVSTDCG